MGRELVEVEKHDEDFDALDFLIQESEIQDARSISMIRNNAVHVRSLPSGKKIQYGPGTWYV